LKTILIPTFYSNKGGSVFIQIKTAEILKKKFNVILKAPLKEADINNFTIYPIFNKTQKVIYFFKSVFIFFKELLWVYKNKIDIIYIHDTPSLYIYGLIGKILKKKVIFHVHDGDIKVVNRKRNILLSDFRIYLNKNLINKNDKNYTLIPNFVENFAIKKVSKEIKKVAIVGSICENKNQLFGIKVINKLNNKKLYLYGDILDKDYYTKLQSYIDNKKIFYMGFEDKRKIFEKVDLIFMPSKNESLGLIWVEALANGIPVLIPNINTIMDIIEEIGYEKFVYQKDDMEDCIKKFSLIEKRFFKENEIFKKRILDRFSIEQFEKKILNLFSTLDIKNEKEN
jgi:glycosyltransferase involved in cell wall biosynthesis